LPGDPRAEFVDIVKIDIALRRDEAIDLNNPKVGG